MITTTANKVHNQLLHLDKMKSSENLFEQITQRDI